MAEDKKLPKGWEWKTLVEVVKKEKFSIVDGPFGTQLHSAEYTLEGIPVVRIKNITRDGKFDSDDLVYISREKFETIKRSAVYPNDIILAKTGATIGKMCLLPKNIKEALIASSCARISIDENIADPKFIMSYLSTKEGQNKIINSSGGSTRNSINLTPIKNIKIPLPPIQIQRKIVEIIEKIENLKKRRGKTNKDTGKLLQFIFINMFGESVKDRNEWKNLTIKDVGEVTAGSTPDTNNDAYWNGSINWVTPAELIDGDNYYYSNTERKITTEGLKSIGNRIFPKDTVLLTSRAPIGKVAIAGVEMSSNQGFKNIICKRDIILPVYLYAWLLINKKYLNSIGTGATFMEINKKTVENIKINVPPISLQNKFVELVEKLEKIKEHQEKSTSEISTLFDALIQSAFNGELKV